MLPRYTKDRNHRVVNQILAIVNSREITLDSSGFSQELSSKWVEKARQACDGLIANGALPLAVCSTIWQSDVVFPSIVYKSVFSEIEQMCWDVETINIRVVVVDSEGYAPWERFEPGTLQNQLISTGVMAQEREDLLG